MRVSTAFNRLLRVPGASVTAVSFEREGVVVSLLTCGCRELGWRSIARAWAVFGEFYASRAKTFPRRVRLSGFYARARIPDHAEFRKAWLGRERAKR